ncbi:MAG TPA: formate dehydrogenase accessory sulfurtransferase FdhD [Caulobacteraceae bacterium]
MTIETAIAARRLRWRPGGADEGVRLVAEETAVALVHDGSTTAVMMASPADLEDLGVGFSLSEGLIERVEEIRDIELVQSALGLEVRMWLTADRSRRLAARRRHLAGPTGCGLCGIESLEEAIRPIRPKAADAFVVTGHALLAAMAMLEDAQQIGRVTRAVHAAGLWRPDAPLIVREDVGRHNALDKLIGATMREGRSTQGVLLLTSRVSVEMIQKAAVLGAPVVCAVSAPTALAVRTAEAAGLTLVAVTRSDGFEVFAHPRRVDLD